MSNINIKKFRKEFKDKLLFDAYKQKHIQEQDFDADAVYLIKREQLMWAHGTYYNIGVGDFIVEWDIVSGLNELTRTVDNYNNTNKQLVLIEKTAADETQIALTPSFSFYKTNKEDGEKLYLYPDKVTIQKVGRDSVESDIYTDTAIISTIISDDFSTQPSYDTDIKTSTYVCEDSNQYIMNLYFGANEDRSYLYKYSFGFDVFIQPPSYAGYFSNSTTPKAIDIPSNADDWRNYEVEAECLGYIESDFNKFLYTPYEYYTLNLLNTSNPGMFEELRMIKTMFVIPSDIATGDGLDSEISEIKDGNGFNYWTFKNEGAYIKNSSAKDIGEFSYYIYTLQAATSVPCTFSQAIK